jgi:hypothetical protein
VPIANGWEDMVAGQLIHSIHLDENTAFHQGGTGCHMETTGNTCGNWDDLTSEGMVALYCFEQ